MQANYVASRMVIVGAGPIEHEELVQMVDKAFSRFVYTIVYVKNRNHLLGYFIR
jgi:predicted Zn-dependent peptidase